MSKELLKKILRKAFNEGAEAPFDLREEIVESLSNKINLNNSIQGNPLEPIDPELAKRIATEIDKNLNNHIKELLKIAPCWLCGGSALEPLIVGNAKTWKNDYNFFCSDINQIPFIGIQLEHINYGNDTTCWSYNENGNKIQIISSEQYLNPITVINKFDLSICQIAFWYDGSPNVFVYKNTWQDIILGQIKYIGIKPIDELSQQNLNKLIARIHKYISRGFRDCTGLIEKGIVPKSLRN